MCKAYPMAGAVSNSGSGQDMGNSPSNSGSNNQVAQSRPISCAGWVERVYVVCCERSSVELNACLSVPNEIYGLPPSPPSSTPPPPPPHPSAPGSSASSVASNSIASALHPPTAKRKLATLDPSENPRSLKKERHE